MSRDHSLDAIRPKLTSEIANSDSVSEAFQNSTLRPILKFQNELLIFLFKASLIKIDFDKKTVFDKKKIIDENLKKNQKLKDQIEVTIIALMRSDELSAYNENRNELKRRIITMACARLKDQLIEK